MDRSEILSSLNESQREAVTTTEGFVRVIAGAGSGKTRALASRYAYLVRELGISPSNIVCITFTNKAAGEMKRRVRRLLGDGIDTSFVATLHAFCTRILREDIGRLFYPENFVVLDNTDQKKILEEVYEEFGIKMDTATFQFMIDKIRYEKNLITYLDYIAVPGKSLAELEPKSLEQRIIFRYIEKQRKYFGLDFFDLINFVIYLFRKHMDILEKWQKRVHYVMVDEFQDITFKEFKLIRQLIEINQNFFVVGDPDQNIYEWRGANMKVILEFEDNLRKYFAERLNDGFSPGHPLTGTFTTVYMNENYRSVPGVVAASNSLIAKNSDRAEKSLAAQRTGGALPVHFHGKSEADEMKYIIGIINEHVAGGGKYSELAVLYRAGYMSRFVEQGFLDKNIPYAIYSGVGFYDRAEIKDVLSYLRLICYEDDLSFLRVVNVPRRKIGKTKLEYLRARAEENHTTLYKALVKYYHEPIFRGTGASEFVDVITRMQKAAAEAQVSELLQILLADSKYELYIRESGDMERLDNVSELARSIVDFEHSYGEPLTLATFLQEVSMGREPEEEVDDKVRLMTMHTAKGLEFHTVFIVGLSEGAVPSARALEERRMAALEEERRLMYVAMTRAKNGLYMTESEGIGFKGRVKVPSRFLFDIDDGLAERIGHIDPAIMDEYRFQIKDRREPGKAIFAVGTQVKHKVFGEGMVEEVNEQTKTYMVRFIHAVKPINFDYIGLSEVF